MNCIEIRTSVVVSGAEIDSDYKLRDLCRQLARKLECRAGFPVRYDVEKHPIRNRIVWKSSRDCYEVSLVALMQDGKFQPEIFAPSLHRAQCLVGTDSALRLFACECASRALHRWSTSGREPDGRLLEAVRKSRAVAEGSLPVSELAVARRLADEAISEMSKRESVPLEVGIEEYGDIIREQMSWYGAVNASHAACHENCVLAAEFASREARREARRVGDEGNEIEWQEERLVDLQIKLCWD